MAVQGYFVAFLFMAVHETAHKTAFRSRGLNLAVGYPSAFIIGQPYEYYCLFHWDHHRYTQDPDKDPELVVGVKPKSDTQLALAYSGLLQVAGRLRLMLGHAVTGKVTVPWIPENKRAIIVREARAYAGLYALLLALSLWFSSALLLWVWIVPLMIGQFFLRPYLYAEHTGCDRTRSAFQNTRTTYTGAIVKWFAWNMPYHVEHHAYPSIPFHALPKLNEIVDGEIVSSRPRLYQDDARDLGLVSPASADWLTQRKTPAAARPELCRGQQISVDPVGADIHDADAQAVAGPDDALLVAIADAGVDVDAAKAPAGTPVMMEAVGRSRGGRESGSTERTGSDQTKSKLTKHFHSPVWR